MRISVTRKSIFVSAILAAFVMGSAFRPKDDHQFTNLKVLPKDISHDNLEAIMKGYNAALGVKCGFCHAKAADGSGHMDFASDDNKHKAIARKMIEMTMDINKKYFDFGGKEKMDAVACMTCHHGMKEPSDELGAPGAPAAPGAPDAPKPDQPSSK